MANYGFSIPTGGYDAEDRLVENERTSGLDQSWSLSLVGNWSSVTTNSTTQTRTHAAAHRMSGMAKSGHSSSTVEHDVKGNVTLIEPHYGMKSNDLELFWDFDNRMSSADTDNDGFKDISHRYDALGRRVYHLDHDLNKTTIFVQFGQQTICDYVGGASPASSTYRYLYASYIDEPVMRWETAEDEAVYCHRNQQYSIIALTDDAGAIVERYSYTAYGEPAFFTGAGTLLSETVVGNRFTYTGSEYDSVTRLYHYRARMYDLQLGRFLGRDPIGYHDGGNLYASYLRLSKVDPSGNETIRFEFNAFINGSRRTWLPEPGTSQFWDREIKTDGRGFGEIGTSRISTKCSIESCAIGLGSPRASTTVGSSHLRRRRVQLHPCIGVLCGVDWLYFEERASLDIDDKVGSYSRPPCRSTIRIKASAGYPFVPFSPNIDFNVTFTFRVVGKDKVLIEFS